MNKRKFRICLALLLTIALTPFRVTDAAKVPELSKSSVNLKVGKSKVVTVENVKAGKSVKWSIVSGGKVIQITKQSKTSIKVHAKKAGSAKISVKVGAKKLYCKIKVKNASSGNSSVKTTYVYITETGSKYHTSGCRYLWNSKIKVSLSSAKSQGYTPCSVCY